MKDNPKTVRELVEARLKEISFWPCPPGVVEAFTAKANSKIASVVNDMIKGASSAAPILAAIDKARVSTPSATPKIAGAGK